MNIQLDISQYLHKFKKYPKATTLFKNERDEMIKKAVEHINLLRKNTPYCNCIETPAKLARRINLNPFLAGTKNNGELRLLLEECRKKNNYSKLYYLLSNKTK